MCYSGFSLDYFVPVSFAFVALCRVEQWQNVGLSAGVLPCPALDLQPMGNHLCG